jgi:hypothetical protein
VLSATGNLKYVKSADVEIWKYESELHEKLKSPEIERVYIHFLIPFLHEAVAKIPRHVKVYWMFWGADGFSLPGIYPDFLDQFSLHFYRTHNYDGKKYKWLHRGMFLESTWERLADYKQKRRLAKKAFERVDFFCHYIEEDFLFLKRKLGLRATYLDFNYCGIEDLFPAEAFKEIRDQRNYAMLGNSASEANNHVSLMRAIQRSNFLFDRLYCPLSYGGNDAYVKEVIKIGHEKFGAKFIPLVDFLNKSDYDEILAGCSHFFHNHYRSQAYGNIVFQLCAGGYVYMNEKSNLYRYLVNESLAIGSIDGEKCTEPGDISDNLTIMQKLLSEEQMNLRYRNCLV